ncbi:MAG: hypothetical protein K9L98_03140 [Candidatus Pacebacteria bacterium]|nr:hypothetical protein [Candidatus Paceibacterota bacterium]MCF7862977.1 hypothetical protein [Candidatus Paceibacterota bacterium]
MTYHLDKKNKTKKIKIISTVLIGTAFFVYFRSPIFNFFSSTFEFIFVPVVNTVNFIGAKVYHMGTGFRFKDSLLKENTNLKNTIFEFESRMQNYAVLEKENEELKSIFSRKNEKLNLILASVLAKPRQSIYGTLIIDVGEDEHIKEGAMVFANGNIPIGKISNVGPKMSKVVLFSNNGETNEVVVSVNKSPKTIEIESEETEKDISASIHFNLVGRGGGNFQIEAPRDLKFEKGQIAILPGIYPFAVAKVEAVISDQKDIVQKVLLVSPINIQEIRFVQVSSSF